MWQSAAVVLPLLLFIICFDCAFAGKPSRQCLLQQGRSFEFEAVRVHASPIENAELYYANLGSGPCILKATGEEPSHSAIVDKTGECEMLCTAKKECEGYALEGLECVLYTEAPLAASGEANSRTECRGKVLRAPDPMQVPPAPAQLPPAPDPTPPAPAPSADGEAERTSAQLKAQIAKAIDSQESIGDGVDAIDAAFSTASQAREQVDRDAAALKEALLGAKETSEACVKLAASMRTELDASRKNKDRFAATAAVLNKKLKKTNAAIKSSNSAVTSMETKLAQSEASAAALEEQSRQLQGDLDLTKLAGDKSANEAATVHEQIAKAKAESSKSSAALQRKAQGLSDATSRFVGRGRAARDEIIEKRDSIQKLRAEIDQVSGALAVAKDSGQKLSEEVATLQSQIDATKEASDRLAADLQTQVQAAKEALDKVTHEVAELEDTLKRSKEETATLHEDNHDLHTELAAARKAADMLGAYRSPDEAEE